MTALAYASPLAFQAHGPESCASCDKLECRLSFASRNIAPVQERVAFVLDEVWPEHRAFVDRQRKEGDQLLAPGLFGRKLARYAWGEGAGAASLATLRRHWTMRRVAKARGAVRQAAYLKHDALLASALARSVDYRARHLVVSQTWLPHLWREGVLGGRTFDVLLTRYPLAALHARLDAVAARRPESVTVADFRAPDALVRAETDALVAARRVVTPHHALAEAFEDKAVLLDWSQPRRTPEREPGTRVAFLGPTAAREGAWEARALALRLPEPLVVFGADLEGPDFWSGVPIERRGFGPGWLNGIGAICHPAAVTHAPRRLLEARAAGVSIYARSSCGLPPGDFRPLEALEV